MPMKMKQIVDALKALISFGCSERPLVLMKRRCGISNSGRIVGGVNLTNKVKLLVSFMCSNGKLNVNMTLAG